jgi:polyribonucleotide 5'-hydroxyl-kinase
MWVRIAIPTSKSHCAYCVVILQLLDGTAEIFGCELSLQQPLDVKGHTLAVFTWEGCKLRVEGTPDLM